MNQKFDPTKPVQTRDGRKARIICTDRKGEMPIVALITSEDGTETISDFKLNGSYWCGLKESDLINIPQRIISTIYIAVWRDGEINMFRTKENAEKCQGNKHLFAIKEITLDATEGEGINERQ